MSSWIKLVTRSSFVAFCLVATSSLAAGNSSAPSEEGQEQSWNREQTVKMKQDSLSIIQQRAQMRADQRQERIATANWYGMSIGRPSGTSTPFTSRYGSVWEMPGGRPYSWTPAYTRPNYVFYRWW
jgi:hypothetical protein